MLIFDENENVSSSHPLPRQRIPEMLKPDKVAVPSCLKLQGGWSFMIGDGDASLSHTLSDAISVQIQS